MTLLPGAVGRYIELAANGDVAALVSCFTEDAVVRDEGQVFRGHDEIRQWRETVTSRFTYTVTVLDSESTGDDTWIVSIRLDGNFPGGTANLKFRFIVEDELISSLSIGTSAIN